MDLVNQFTFFVYIPIIKQLGYPNGPGPFFRAIFRQESTLQRCFGRAGKVEEIRFLPQEIAVNGDSSVRKL